MRHLSVCKFGRELVAGFAQRQGQSSLTPFSFDINRHCHYDGLLEQRIETTSEVVLILMG
jgi:hypothetical protein